MKNKITIALPLICLLLSHESAAQAVSGFRFNTLTSLQNISARHKTDILNENKLFQDSILVNKPDSILSILELLRKSVGDSMELSDEYKITYLKESIKNLESDPILLSFNVKSTKPSQSLTESRKKYPPSLIESEVKLAKDRLIEFKNKKNSLLNDYSNLESNDSRVNFLKEEIKNIELQYDLYEDICDSLIIKKEEEHVSSNYFVYNFSPTRSKAFFNMIYDGKGKMLNTVNSAGINFGNKTGSIYSEVASGNFGLIRATIGTMLTNSSKTDSVVVKEETAYQKLASMGGNVVLNLEHPVLFLNSKGSLYTMIVRAIGKGTTDIPAFENQTTGFAGSVQGGLDVYGHVASDNGQIRAYSSISFSIVKGSKEFHDNLDIARKRLFFGQITAGVVLLDRIRVSFSLLSFGSDASIRNKKVIIGGQFVK